MQKRKKRSRLLWCIVPIALSVLLLTQGLVGEVMGKYVKEFSFLDLFTVPAKSFSYWIKYINEGVVLYEVEIPLGQGVDETKLAEYHNTAETALEEQMKGETDTYSGVEFSYWMNAGSNQVTTIAAGNEEDIELYPKFDNLYTAMFVDQDGSLLAWCFFSSTNYTDKVTAAEATANSELAQKLAGSGFELDYWTVKGENIDAQYAIGNFANYTTDVTIYPVYKFNGDVQLIPVDTDGDGDTDYYQVGGYNSADGSALVEIPASVNGIPVTEINAEAFNSYDDLTAVVIPDTIESIGSKVFSDSTIQRQTVTIYYDGDPDKFRQYMDIFYANTTKYGTRNGYKYTSGETIFTDSWDSGMGDGSRIFFLGEDGLVDESKGYWELCKKIYNTIIGFYDDYSGYIWVFHNHPYPTADQVSNGAHTYNGVRCEQPDGTQLFHFATWTDYANGRVDSKYWTETATTGDEE